MKTIKAEKLLESLNKYVYIDVWATWCGPCLQSTIPAKMEEQYQGKKLNLSAFQLTTLKIEKNGVIL
jgi:thiol-disulfide isomerase/thioredoxin